VEQLECKEFVDLLKNREFFINIVNSSAMAPVICQVLAKLQLTS
jgi:hypothetical protein